ncbi:MAG: hypothetical protein ACKVVP_07380 [Chloroflexota bacterium]
MPYQPGLRLLVAVAVIASSALLQAQAPPAFGQAPVIVPKDVALAPSDLPAGFQLDPVETKDEPVQNIGVSYTVAMKRDPSPANLADGPVAIWQMVLRIDRLVVPVDFFAEVRDRIIADQNLGPFPGGANTPTTVHLIGEVRADGQGREVYAVGRVRDNLIWFTVVGGVSPSTSIQSAIVLTDVSMAKYERVRLSSNPRALMDSLFQTPFLSDELPTGFRSGNLVKSEASERAAAHDALGEVDLQIQGPGLENLITYIVYPSDLDAKSAFDEAPVRAAERGSQIARPDGFPYPVLCAMRGGEVDGRKLGATSCLALVGNVEVSAFSLIENAEVGALQDSLVLMAAGVKHLERVSR